MFISEIIILIAIFALDMGTKVASVLYFNPKLEIIPGVLSFKYLENEGASFGILQGGRVFFIILTVLAAAGMVWFLNSIKKKNLNKAKFFRIALVLILAGALGNLFDRIAYGYVRDFIYLEIIDFAIFNVADSSICIGAVLLCVYIIFMYNDPETAAKQPETAENQAVAVEEKTVGESENATEENPEEVVKEESAEKIPQDGEQS